MNVLIIDTETANSVACPLPYDIGYSIVNLETRKVLLERSFIVAEIFFDKELMEQAYFAEKIPQYFKEIKNGKRKVTSITKIRNTARNDMKIHKVKKIGAYNMGFDNRAVKNDVRYISGSFIRWFFPYGTELFCIWNMACSSILSTDEYVNFAIKNNLVSECGNIRTSAEAAYKFIKNNPNFLEEHTGLEDVKIETEILFAILDSKMEYEKKLSPACWRKVQDFAGR